MHQNVTFCIVIDLILRVRKEDVPLYVLHAPTYVYERTLSNQGNDAFLCYQGTRETNTSC